MSVKIMHLGQLISLAARVVDVSGIAACLCDVGNVNDFYCINEELRDLYSSASRIRIRVIKPRRMRRAGHVARLEEKKNLYRLLIGRLEGKR
jgi:hypothetical protein